MADRPSLGTVLKQMLQRRDAPIVPGAANALAARVIADLGFEAIYVTGAGVTNMNLGLPDLGLVTLSELAGHVAAIRDVVDLPLIVDADTGFGNPVNTVRTVRVLERSGANGIQLEDQVFPKKCGHFDGKDVIPAADMVQKIRAAVDTRRDTDFQVIARTDARAGDGLEAALDRARLYAKAGADATFVEAPAGAAELARIAAELPVPQVANLVFGGRTPLVPRAELQRMGFGMVLYANAALQGALWGMQNALGALRRDGELDRVRHQLATFDERQRLVDKAAFDVLEQRYGTGTVPPGTA
jgi:2-methylisocitrate lyase-like PEP mutase family enzyme